MTAPALELTGIDKSFGAVRANRSVDLSVATGSIHGIVGENGAGKSTLMSIVYGFYQADAGGIRVAGRSVTIRSPAEAIAAGIGMVHQHFMLVETLSVIENVMLGAEGGALIRRGEAMVRAEMARLGETHGLALDPDAIVGDLPVGLQQRVEIVKALTRGARVLILDEPTAVLTPAEAGRLFALLAELKREGRTVILITHKLREIMAATDRVSVMRRGEMVATLPTSATGPQQLAELMVGRRVAMQVEKAPASPGEAVLEVEGLGLRDARGVSRLSDVSFTLRRGEILGLAGVSGNGQSELLAVLAGLVRPDSGTVRLAGTLLGPRDFDAHAMRRRGLMHVPEDRLRAGLVPAFPAYESAILGYHDDPAFGGRLMLERGRMVAHLSRAMADYDIRPPDPHLRTATFSGGNQQKIVLSREIERAPAVLLVGQPTRGVDIGAIEFIHRRLVALRDAGTAILLVSVELDEIRALADRVLVMCAGRIVGERPPDCDERELGLMMAGIAGEAA
jgi:simple sugar transport system ATP-binding protein